MGISYRYIIVTNDEDVVQFDWLMSYRPNVELTEKAEYTVPVSKELIGKKLKDVRKPLYYFSKPK